MSRTLAIVIRVVIAVLYTALYGICALIAAGGGHGSMFFIFPLFTWIFALIAFIFVDRLPPIAFLVLMAVHYSYVLMIGLVLATHGLDPNEIKYWNSEAGVVVFSTLVYMVGQALIWVWFVMSRRATDFSRG